MAKTDTHDTFFGEVRHGACPRTLSFDEITVFRAAVADGVSFHFSPMLSDAFCIMFVRSGTALFSVDYHTDRLGSGTLLFLTPKMVFSLDCADNDFVMEGVCFAPAYFDSLASHAPVYNQMISYMNEYPLPVLALSGSESDCLMRMMSLYAEVSKSCLHSNGILLHLSNLLLLQVSEWLHVSCSADTGKVSHAVELYRSFRKLLTSNYSTEHYIAFYADRLCISPAYLSRVVRNVSGQTVNYHISHMLLTRARCLLDCSDRSVKQIADMLGFADQASFGKFFREQMGMSPTAYRDTARR